MSRFVLWQERDEPNTITKTITERERPAVDMPKPKRAAEVYKDADSYREHALRTVHDQKADQDRTYNLFCDALADVAGLLKRDGMTAANAITAAFRVVPGPYSELRLARNARYAGLASRDEVAKRAARIRANAAGLASMVAKDNTAGSIEEKLMRLAASHDWETE